MEAALMMKTSLALLTLAAIGGVVMAVIRVFYAENPPTWLAMAHGMLAGAALTLLIYGWLTVGLPGLAIAAVLIFLIAAAVGTWLHLHYHANRVPLPKLIVIAHGIGGVAGYILLAMAVMR